jgi:hypothetical protein
MTSIQCYLIDPENAKNIRFLEEEQETFELAVEYLDMDLEPIPFQFFAIHLEEEIQKERICFHPEKEYPSISLSVPFSPPEFS